MNHAFKKDRKAGICIVAFCRRDRLSDRLRGEKLTGLPLHPGLTFEQDADSAVCGKKANMNLYDTPPDASLESYIAWHKQQLKNFHYVHKVWGGRPREIFYSPDGSKGIGITGTPHSTGVFAVAYMKFSSNLTTHQEDPIEPSNASCR